MFIWIFFFLCNFWSWCSVHDSCWAKIETEPMPSWLLNRPDVTNINELTHELIKTLDCTSRFVLSGSHVKQHPETFRGDLRVSKMWLTRWSKLLCGLSSPPRSLGGVCRQVFLLLDSFGPDSCWELPDVFPAGPENFSSQQRCKILLVFQISQRRSCDAELTS